MDRTGVSPRTLLERWTATSEFMVCRKYFIRIICNFDPFPEIPGTSKKPPPPTPVSEETNEILRGRKYFTATPSNGHYSQDHWLRYSDELDGEDGDENDLEEEETSNPTRSTSNGFSKHKFSSSDQGKHSPALPPMFMGPELVAHGSSVKCMSSKMVMPIVVSWIVFNILDTLIGR